MGKLLDELRRRYKTPKDAVLALGLDAALLEEKNHMPQLSMRAAVTKGALLNYLSPRLAMDANIDLNPIIKGLTRSNFGSRKSQIVTAIKAATRGKLAQDADIDDLPELLQMLEKKDDDGEDDADLLSGVADPFPAQPGQPAVDLEANAGMPQALEYLRGKIPAEDWGRVRDMLGCDEESEEEAAERQREEDAEDRRCAEDIRRCAEDAHRRLGRDESPEEEDQRERAEDARRILGRDETEEERERREGEDAKRAMDSRRAAEDAAGGRREAEDARRRRMAADRARDRKHAMDRKRAEDRKRRAEDRRRAAMDAARREAEDRKANDRRRAGDRRAHDEPPPFPGKPVPGGEMVSQKAMDAAINSAVQAERQRQRAVREAMANVRSKVGDLALDSAETADDVYRAALNAIGVPGVEKIHPSAYKTILDMQPGLYAQTNTGISPVRQMAMDASGGDAKGFEQRFGPAAARIRSV